MKGSERGGERQPVGLGWWWGHRGGGRRRGVVVRVGRVEGRGRVAGGTARWLATGRWWWGRGGGGARMRTMPVTFHEVWGSEEGAERWPRAVGGAANKEVAAGRGGGGGEREREVDEGVQLTRFQML